MIPAHRHSLTTLRPDAGYRIVHADGTSIGSLPPPSRASVNGAVVAATS